MRTNCVFSQNCNLAMLMTAESFAINIYCNWLRNHGQESIITSSSERVSRILLPSKEEGWVDVLGVLFGFSKRKNLTRNLHINLYEYFTWSCCITHVANNDACSSIHLSIHHQSANEPTRAAFWAIKWVEGGSYRRSTFHFPIAKLL